MVTYNAYFHARCAQCADLWTTIRLQTLKQLLTATAIAFPLLVRTVLPELQCFQLMLLSLCLLFSRLPVSLFSDGAEELY
jgi:hypothetical protein